MKNVFTYVTMMLWLLASCQTPQLVDMPVGGSNVEGVVSVTFNVALQQDELDTRARGDLPSTDIENMYLVVFDENGYYVETNEAHFIGQVGDEASGYSRYYTVTLRKTDKMRIIHFIANCPVDQIRYGHETEVIADMYVEDDKAAYWHRMSVWYVMTETQNDTEVLVPEIQKAFSNIPLLRNYASIQVRSTAPDFVPESYGIYNTISKGTVAAYCSEHHEFHSFIDANGDQLTYDQHLVPEHEYRGHALYDVSLDGTLTEDDLKPLSEPTYMYERKISVRTGDEQKWNESPSHIIVKGRYGNGPSTYYKMDMVREKNGKNEYYNILRNFRYTFTITSIAGDGYSTLQEAMSKPAGNNLSGATDTQDCTNVSDGLGRIFVSYTDTTLVSSDHIKLRYKYIPSVVDGEVHNDRVSVSGILDGTGSVLKAMVNEPVSVADGWQEVEFEVQQPGAISHIQEITLMVNDNFNLHKTIRYRLQKPYDMQLECTPSHVNAMSGTEVAVLIRIPGNLPANIFPLYFNVETLNHTLSPDVSKDNNVMAVESGVSIVGGSGKNSYYFVKTLTYDDYQNLRVVDKQKVVATYWWTTKAASASTIYVANKYFNIASTAFENGPGFQDLSFPNGVLKTPGVATEFTFYMNMSYLTDVTVTLSRGLTSKLPSATTTGDGKEQFTYRPTSLGKQTLILYTTDDIAEFTGNDAVEVKLEAGTNSAKKSAIPSSSIVIPKLTVDFWYYHNWSPSVNTITPVLSIDNGRLEHGEVHRSRDGSSTRYHYYIEYSDVKITGADQNAVVNVSLVYNNGHGGVYTYKGSKTVNDLLTNPYISISE